jgi:hypothetical protein
MQNRVAHTQVAVKLAPNVPQAGVRFLLCQVTYLSVNPQKMVACLVLAGRNRHTGA